MGPDTSRPGRPVSSLDVTAERCPATMMRIRTALRRIESGQVLEIFLSQGEQIQDVPAALKEDGHQVILVRPEGGRFRVLVAKDALAARDAVAAADPQACCPGGNCGAAGPGGPSPRPAAPAPGASTGRAKKPRRR